MEAERLRKQKAAAEMAEWLERTKAENERRYQDMLAAALAMLPGGANNDFNGRGDADDEAKRRLLARPTWFSCPQPRVERMRKETIAYRASAHPLNASVAFPRPREVSCDAWRPHVMNGSGEFRPLSRSASAAAIGLRAPPRPGTAPHGTPKQLARVTSAGPLHQPTRTVPRLTFGI